MQAADITALPQPDDSSLAHSEKVEAYIREAIDAAGGAIGFAEFMHHALYAPGLGYYAAGSAKFGAAGDFVTAPEISPLFSRVVSRQVAGVLDSLDDPGGRNVFEFGAGTGSLASEMLLALQDRECLPARYYILEVSADLRSRQEELLRSRVPEAFDRVSWLNGLPTDFSGVVIANELLDAFPVERFTKRDGEVLRDIVAWTDGRFTWRNELAQENLRLAVASIESDIGETLPDGYTSEISLAMPSWIGDLSASLKRGCVLLFDYGVSRHEYYAADRSDGWLRCHFQHHAHSNPLVYPGIQDLTAWVDFSAVAAAAVEAGMQVAGYLPQGQFLMLGGLQDEISDFAGLTTAAQMELSGQIKVLTMPGEMGENVKCLALSKGDVATPGVLNHADRAHTL